MLGILQEITFILATIMSFGGIPVSCKCNADDTTKYVILTLCVWVLFLVISFVVGL